MDLNLTYQSNASFPMANIIIIPPTLHTVQMLLSTMSAFSWERGYTPSCGFYLHNFL